MFELRKYVFCPLLAAAALLSGSAAYASGMEAVSAPEITVTLPAAASASHIDLSAPETAPAGVSFIGDTVTVTAAGTYRLTGALQGRVLVEADGPVDLILAGVSLQGEACLENDTKDPLTVTLEAGTLNVLLDGLTAPDDNARAAIVSKGPLTIHGDGSLTVVSNGKDALECKDGLTLSGGSLYIKAADEGVQSRGPIAVTGGDIRINAQGDGMAAEAGRVTSGDIAISDGRLSVTSHSRGLDAEEGNILLSGGELIIDSVDDGLRALDITQTGGTVSITARGYTPEDKTAEETIAGDGVDGDTIAISGGKLIITSAGDGIQALTALTVTDGSLSITSGGGGGDASSHAGDMFMMGPPGRSSSSSSSSSTVSAKGLKSDGDITISGGVIGLNTADDSIHGARLCTIDGGEIYIYSSDDGIHCDDMLLINGGNITIYDCFEGLEAFAIEIHGGTTSVYAVNDGVNANGPEGWGWGGNTSVTDSVSGYSTTYYWQSAGWVDLVVTGSMNNMGDGMDSNGSLYVTGGHLTVSTPGTFMENGIDGGHTFYISGGEVMAGGASAMQPTPYSTTDQCVAVISSMSGAAGSVVTVSDSGGNEIWSHTIPNYFSCLIVSHPAMTQGNVYTVTCGTQNVTLDFTSTTSLSVGSGGFGGPGGGRGGRP